MYLITLSRLRPEDDLLHHVNCPSRKPLLLIKRGRLKEIRTTSPKCILHLTTPFYRRMCIVLEKNNAGKRKLLGAASAQISAERSSQGKVTYAALALPLYILTYP